MSPGGYEGGQLKLGSGQCYLKHGKAQVGHLGRVAEVEAE